MLKDKDETAIRELKSLAMGIEEAVQKSALSNDIKVNFTNLSTSALNNYIDQISGNEKGSGGKSSTSSGGLDLSGLVAAPGNTSEQRLGTGGPGAGDGNGNKNPKKKEKECNVNVVIHQVNDFELPQPDWVYHVNVDINIDGDEDCQAEEIQFTLFDVSQERGRCINDQEQYDDVGPDLVINSGYTNPDLDVTSPSTAGKTLSGGSQTVPINITCNDYGAYGKLKVSVKVKGQWYDGDADGTPDKFITIPVDLNNNKIADSWEKQNGVYGSPADKDDDPEPTGQATNGDGLTNYEEYRGVYVSDGNGGVEHIRLNPKKKEIFVIDEGQIFSPVSWKSASGMDAYWLTNNLVYGSRANGDEILSNKVNFCSGFDQAPAGSKYAIRLERVDDLHDPHGIENDDSLPLGYTYPGIGPPKNIKYCVIFVARIKMWFQDVYVKKLTDLIKKNPKGVTIHGKYFSKATLDYFLNAVTDPSKLQQFVDQEVNTTVIHELGHACGLEHHETGDVKCPMCWGARLDQAIDDRMYNIMTMIDNGEKNIIAIYTYLKFCKTGNNCWSKLDVNDK